MCVKNWCRLAEYREIANSTFSFLLCELFRFPRLWSVCSAGLKPVPRCLYSDVFSSSLLHVCFSPRLASPALSVSFGSKDISQTQMVSKSWTPFITRSLCVGTLCANRKHFKSQSPHPAWQVTLVKPLQKCRACWNKLSPWAFLLLFHYSPRFLGWIDEPVHLVLTSRGGKVSLWAHIISARGPFGAPALGRRSVSALSGAKDTHVYVLLALVLWKIV